MWAALRERFAAEEFVPRPAEAGPCRIPGKGSLGQQNGPGNLVSGREKRCLADHARGVNWPFSIHVYTAWDQQAGTIDVEDFAFPYAAESFDACMLASVFTHMPPNEARHYLGELARVTRSGGKILLSIFFSQSGVVETRDEGVNVLHNPQEFLTDLEQLPFDVRRVSPLAFGYEHNWYVLTKR